VKQSILRPNAMVLLAILFAIFLCGFSACSSSIPDPSMEIMKPAKSGEASAMVGTTETESPANESSPSAMEATPSASSEVSASLENPFRTEPKEIFGYLPLWDYACCETLDYKNLTHISLAFVNPDEKGNMVCEVPEADLKAIVMKAHDQGVKVLVSLGGAGGSDNYPKLISEPEPRKAFVANLASFVSDYALDGIDLDIEGEAPPLFWSSYELWVTALRSLCDEKGLLLTTAVGNWYAGNITPKTYGMFDRIAVMAYDNDVDTMHATYQYAKDCIGFFSVLRKIPKEKLLLGVPFYGRGYDANGKLDWNSYIAYKDLLKLNPAAGAGDSSNGYGYNGTETLLKKCDLARDCAGMMVWELSQDASGEASLLKLMRDNLP